jgi:hypothetical protein
MLKRLAMIALLLAPLTSAKPKTYVFQLDGKAQVGKVQLEAGRYRLLVDGSSISLIDKTGKAIDARIKTESSEQTYSATAVSATNRDGIIRVDGVSLKGTKTKVVFE